MKVIDYYEVAGTQKNISYRFSKRKCIKEGQKGVVRTNKGTSILEFINEENKLDIDRAMFMYRCHSFCFR